MWPNPQFPADLVTFTEEILNGKMRFLSSEYVIEDTIKTVFMSNLFHDVLLLDYINWLYYL